MSLELCCAKRGSYKDALSELCFLAICVALLLHYS